MALDTEVLLPHMRDPKHTDSCALRTTPKRTFSSIINSCMPFEKKGQCTEWADGRYYQLTGHHMEFNGPAHSWPNLARLKPDEWVVSETPITPSVAIYPPGIYGAGPAGHAA
ncbi:hypothetical protein L0F63_002263, partial [Massospora cicadina]